MVCISANLFSQSDEIRIMDITVEGNQRLTAQDVQRNARLYKVMTIKGPEIQQAIKRLWNLKRFGNIQIMVDDETDEGIYLQIVVEENPTLGEVKFEGNKKKSTRTLNEELELNIGQILSEYAVFEAIEKIKSLYAEKNYHSVSIKGFNFFYCFKNSIFGKNLPDVEFKLFIQGAGGLLLIALKLHFTKCGIFFNHNLQVNTFIGLIINHDLDIPKALEIPESLNSLLNFRSFNGHHFIQARIPLYILRRESLIPLYGNIHYTDFITL
jgi:outer membrane protein insertion porin family